MIGLHSANDKLREAEFFFMLMDKHSEKYEFMYFLSAFLSALSSCTEHNRLQSSDQRFRDWYREIAGKLIVPSVLPKLDRQRDSPKGHCNGSTRRICRE
jgi:hypothetical protein